MHFTDLAAQAAAGLAFERVASARDAVFEALKARPIYTFLDLPATPLKSRGAPGVAVFDFDADGDLDLFVPNGPGRAHSLFSNQLKESGHVTFVDVAAQAGVDAPEQDGGGACFGDVDNDGDEDLLVVSLADAPRLFLNRGDGTFEDLEAESGLGATTRGATSCSMGDVDGDGRLDVAVANAYVDFSQQVPIFVEPFALNEHNQLFHNADGRHFVDVSQAAGVEDLAGVPPGAATITWAIALVDVDQDGDLDLVHADDQAAIPRARDGGVDRGFIHVFSNDGSGHFTDRTLEWGTAKAGQWMGLGFGDLDCDGRLDLFGSNVGDYMITNLPMNYVLGDSASRWFLGRAGGFSDPGVGALVATPFGWGNELFDYDNDGDLDIVFVGGLDVGPFVDGSNPGTLLRNPGCSGRFVRAGGALVGGRAREELQGLAVGDLDGNGFPDLVAVSELGLPAGIPARPYDVSYGSPFDAEAVYYETFRPLAEPGTFVWGGVDPSPGRLFVDLNSGDNGNHWAAVTPLGSVGLTPRGRVNRDGIGAVLRFTPDGGRPVTKPVIGGASYASQSAREQTFGLGAARRGTLDVLWPGGVRNRLYGVRAGERLRVPEIPCSFDGEWARAAAYAACVRAALDDLVGAGALSRRERGRFLSSALRAFAGD